MTELTVLREGSLDHRDSLGNRGSVTAPAVRLVSGGAGIVTEAGPSRALQRDGGRLDVTSLRWLQPGPPTIPTTRIAEEVPTRHQGRAVITRCTGPDGAIVDPVGVEVAHVDVPAGATVDLELEGGVAYILLRAGSVLIGDDLRAVDGPELVVLEEAGRRLTIATRLDDDHGADLLVIRTPRIESGTVHRHAMIAGSDDEDLASALEASHGTGYGTLPRG